jgi:uncharacterized protein (UPF0335 family)
MRKPKPTATPTTSPAGPGHNSIDRDKLREIVSRIESIEQERAELGEDVRALYQEARSAGFDTAAIRTIVKLRKQDASERQEREELVQSYLEALGDLVGTPLGDHAISRASSTLMPPV